MPRTWWLTSGKYLQLLAILSLIAGLVAGQAQAKSFDTSYVLEKMPQKERLVHIDGVVRGIAFAHYFHNNKDEAGFNCMLGYALAGKSGNWDNMISFAKRYPQKPLGGVLFLYLRKKCKL